MTTGSASAVTQASATLNGTVNPEFAATTCHFDYGLSTAYGSQSPPASAGSGGAAVPVSANVTGLAASTGYHFRLTCSNSKGTRSGADASFTTSATAPSGFVTQNGLSLTLNGAPFRMLGFNEWRAAVTSWNKPGNTGYLLNDGTALNDGIAEQHAYAPHLNVIRFWAFQQFALNSAGNPAPSLPYDWSAIDKAIAVAASNGLKVIVDLEDNNGWERTSPPSASPTLQTSWYQSGYQSAVLPYEAVPYAQWVHDFAAHEGDNPAIAVVELINEPDISGEGGQPCPSNAGAIAQSFAETNAAVVHQFMPHALVSMGTAGEVCGFAGSDMNGLLAQPDINLASFHDYTGNTNAGGTWGGSNGLDDECSRAVSSGKPVYDGEIGDHLSGLTAQQRAGYLNAKLSAQFAYNSGTCLAGAVPWGFDARGADGSGDDYMYPAAGSDPAGDPAFGVLDSYHQ